MLWTRGPLWFSVAQFRDNVLLATNLPLPYPHKAGARGM